MAEFDPLQTPDPGFRVPDLVQCVEGWRSWEISGEVPPYGAAPKLYSVIQTNVYWVPRRALEAACECRKGVKEEEPPCEHGPCGFYSAKTREHLLSMNYHTYDGERSGMYCVIGRVANWGKVIEGTLGWRAQFSYPVELFVPYEIWKLARPLQRAYGTRVRLDNFLKEPGSAIA